MAGQSRALLQIGDWVVDPDTDTIARGSELAKLEPRAMRLLLLLAQSPGAVISVDRMLTEIWPGVIVGPASVYQAISQLRRALADTDPEPTYIATVPRKGYRLIAPVRPVTASSPPQPAAAPAAQPAAPPTPPTVPAAVDGPPPSVQKRRPLRLALGSTAALAVLALLAAVLWPRVQRYFAPPPSAPS